MVLWSIRVYVWPNTSNFNTRVGASCSSEIERPLMVSWVVGSISHGGPTDLFVIPSSAGNRKAEPM